MATTAPKTRKTMTVKIPREKGSKEDKFVSVNDHNFIIQKGVNVEVPTYVYKQLAHEEEQLELIYEKHNKK